MATIRSGASSTEWTIDTASQAGRVTLYDASGVAIIGPQSKVTYMAASTMTPVATATDMITIGGSGTKTVKVMAIKVSTTVTTAGVIELRLIKRSAANTAGGSTFVAATKVALDSTSAAATATVGHWTVANPTLGATVGTIVITRQNQGIVTASTNVTDAGMDMLFQNALRFDTPIVLRGTAEQLAVNYNGAALIAGQTHSYHVIWTEE